MPSRQGLLDLPAHYDFVLRRARRPRRRRASATVSSSRAFRRAPRLDRSRVWQRHEIPIAELAMSMERQQYPRGPRGQHLPQQGRAGGGKPETSSSPRFCLTGLDCRAPFGHAARSARAASTSNQLTLLAAAAQGDPRSQTPQREHVHDQGRAHRGGPREERGWLFHAARFPTLIDSVFTEIEREGDPQARPLRRSQVSEPSPLKRRKARTGRNPRDRRRASKIPASKTVGFEPAPKFKESPCGAARAIRACTPLGQQVEGLQRLWSVERSMAESSRSSADFAAGG